MFPTTRAATGWLFLLCALGCGPRADLERLRASLSGSDPVAQQSACAEVATFGSRSQPLVGELVPLLSSTDPTTRRLAAYAIQEIGAGAEPAIAALKAMLSDTNRDLAVAAANALSRIAPDAAPVEVGDVYWKRFEEPDPALASYRRAVAADPKNPAAYTRLAEVQRWLGQAEEAKRNQEKADEFRKAVSASPGAGTEPGKRFEK